jgi:uncharacterized protein (DUF2147 family)
MRQHAKNHRTVVAIFVATAALIGPAHADGYPISGTWTYDQPSGQGPASGCGSRTMTFGNGTRQDSVGSVPQLKNKSTTQTGDGQFNVVDTFYNGQTWGSVSYSMHVVDPDHVEINYGKGSSYELRRCQ